MFVGREEELALLQSKSQSDRSELVVIYGRRRIGKSALIQEFIKRERTTYFFEGLENKRTPEQINNFVELLKEQSKDEFLENAVFKSWRQVFDYLTKRVFNASEKQIVVFDEFQWMAAGQTKLVSLLKYYWDNHWKNQNIMLILCGSMFSFIVNKVIKSKALYGRINQEILLEELYPNESAKFFKNKRSMEEILKYLIVFGGIPKYLEEIDLNLSFKQNMNQLCFTKGGFMVGECEKVFYSQFGEYKNYLKIVETVKEKAYSFGEIVKKTNIPRGGSIKDYLENLEKAQVISTFISIDMKQNTKFVKYRLSDEYLAFYYKYMSPNLRIIKKQKDPSRKLFEDLCETKWQPWLGLAFERFCLKNALHLAERMGFGDRVIDFAPYYGRHDHKFQIDLLYKRSDHVITLCEIKYHNQPVSTDVIAEVERKSKLFANKMPRGYVLERALISASGVDCYLRQAEYFHHILSLDNLF